MGSFAVLLPNHECSSNVWYIALFVAGYCSIGIAFVGGKAHGGDTSNPMTQLQRGYRVALGLSIVGFYFITSWLLEDPESPGSAFKFFLCGITGMVCAYIIVLSTQYYTDYEVSIVLSCL